jgi:hypothetical protein
MCPNDRYGALNHRKRTSCDESLEDSITSTRWRKGWTIGGEKDGLPPSSWPYNFGIHGEEEIKHG